MADASTTAQIERETAFLMRALEAVQRLQKYPLERAHYLALRAIDGQAPQTVASIACQLLLDNSTVTRQVMEMELVGLVTKRPNPADGRSALVDITARGRAQAMQMRQQRMERIDRLVRDWSARQRQDFAVLLGRYNAALARRARETPTSGGKSTGSAAPK